ncbi:DUF481 domain-containing protein [Mesohalobacter halotolerans]|uniref:DUF481 domain-containing protein n=1 Tax=Mesohalobacter halotolerans TaxID=1883405 RepID=A0A4U5TQZ7_9FLAO|nr:DUF481 domain-containing protein [Mesohalobacter halotolerans]TKS56496.1 DUF481 domain-containing protein [Mesohalobacter halotolerans]
MVLNHRSLTFIFGLITFFITTSSLFAQTDSLYLKNNDVIVGELKSLNKSVAVFETDYSDSDFKIDWDEVLKVKTQTEYLLTLSSGRRFSGHLESSSENQVHVIENDSIMVETPIEDIVYLRKIDSDFWSKFDASLSVGYNFTKANDLSQYSVRSYFGYREKRWLASTRYNQIISSQSDTPETQRLDANLIYNRFLRKNWFILGEVNWLSNTAQNLDLRTVSKVGLGKYIIQTNSSYWGLQAGVSFNNESFNTDMGGVSNNSAEGFLGTEVNLYDIGDFSLLSRVMVYPSLTESGRWRTDFNMDLNYDLPLDFFINLGLSLNYDNQPAQGGEETDYVFQTTFGWSL